MNQDGVHERMTIELVLIASARLDRTADAAQRK
jgi:hypothetical protein